MFSASFELRIYNKNKNGIRNFSFRFHNDKKSQIEFQSIKSIRNLIKVSANLFLTTNKKPIHFECWLMEQEQNRQNPTNKMVLCSILMMINIRFLIVTLNQKFFFLSFSILYMQKLRLNFHHPLKAHDKPKINPTLIFKCFQCKFIYWKF